MTVCSCNRSDKAVSRGLESQARKAEESDPDPKAAQGSCSPGRLPRKKVQPALFVSMVAISTGLTETARQRVSLLLTETGKGPPYVTTAGNDSTSSPASLICWEHPGTKRMCD